jgi:hypothetical protein
MKNYVKLFLSLLIIAGFLLPVGVWYIMTKREIYKPNPTRPKDFPEILIAPEHAISLDHSIPSRRVPHVYGLSFVVHDPYPSKDTRNFIKEHLTSNGWQRLNYELLNPNNAIAPPSETMPQSLPSHTMNFLQKQGYQRIPWSKEDWVSKDDEYINVILCYSVDLATTEVHRDKPYVNLSLFERESWVRHFILRYKELHPEEFESSKKK